jgi:hypothetical protein
MQTTAQTARNGGVGLVSLRQERERVTSTLPLKEGRFGATTHFICIPDCGSMTVFSAKYIDLMKAGGLCIKVGDPSAEVFQLSQDGAKSGKGLTPMPAQTTHCFEISEPAAENGKPAGLLGNVSIIQEISGSDRNHMVLKIAPASSHGMDILRPIADEAMAQTEAEMKDSFQPPILGIDHFSFEKAREFLPRGVQ